MFSLENGHVKIRKFQIPSYLNIFMIRFTEGSWQKNFDNLEKKEETFFPFQYKKSF